MVPHFQLSVCLNKEKMVESTHAHYDCTASVGQVRVNSSKMPPLVHTGDNIVKKYSRSVTANLQSENQAGEEQKRHRLWKEHFNSKIINNSYFSVFLEKGNLRFRQCFFQVSVVSSLLTYLQT